VKCGTAVAVNGAGRTRTHRKTAAKPKEICHADHCLHSIELREHGHHREHYGSRQVDGGHKMPKKPTPPRCLANTLGFIKR
jgi:hypothetical protein